MKMEDIPSGESWACRFKTTTFVDPDTGMAVEDKNLAVGAAHRGLPSEYTSIGLIQIRDSDTKIVQVLDTVSSITVKVPFEQCWDLDTVEWINDPDAATELA